MPLIDGKTDSKNSIGIFDFNLLEDSNSSQNKSVSEPIYEDGEYWSETAFDAKFSASEINLRNFPFDSQKLEIIITSDIFETDELIFNPKQFRLPSKAFNILGYKLDGINIEDTVRIYSSNFYDSSEVNWRNRNTILGYSQSEATTQSQPIFVVNISRDSLTSVIEYIVPILIVCLLGALVSFLSVELPEIKLSAPPAAILSLIFLQNSFMNAIPRTSYLTCMDLLFALAYIACFLSFLNSFLERVYVNYNRYKYFFEKSGLVVILISPIVIKVWLKVHE